MPQSQIDYLSQQVCKIVQRGEHVVHGPDTKDHFDTFSMDAVMEELKQEVPDVFQLFMSLGEARRSQADPNDEVGVEQIKSNNVTMYPA